MKHCPLPAFTLIAILLALAGMAYAQEAPCYPRDVLAGYLRDKGLPLHAWGLTSDGKMQELFLGGGNWVVIETTPGNCARVVSALDKEGGRLWRPEGNKALKPRPMSPGLAM